MIYEVLEDRAVQEIWISPTEKVEILALDICKCCCCRTLDRVVSRTREILFYLLVLAVIKLAH